MKNKSLSGYLVVEQHGSYNITEFHDVYLDEAEAEAEVARIKEAFPSSNVFIEYVSVVIAEEDND